MSSTHMDLSPHDIDRTQDITSWPEGDLTGFPNGDRTRYQQRKAALLDYFQSALSVDEIAARHQLPRSDALEALARRCLTRHSDGRLWGFRALLPAVLRADPGPAPVDRSQMDLDLDLDTHVLEHEDEDTVEREAVLWHGAPARVQESEEANPQAPEVVSEGAQERTDEQRDLAPPGPEEDAREEMIHGPVQDEEAEEAQEPLAQCKEADEVVGVAPGEGREEEREESLLIVDDTPGALPAAGESLAGVEGVEHEEVEEEEESAGDASEDPAQEEQAAADETSGEQSELAERETVEMATLESVRERVRAVDTVIVPAAALDVLAASETLETSVVSPAAGANGHAVPAPREQQEAEEQSLPVPDSLAAAWQERQPEREDPWYSLWRKPVDRARNILAPTRSLVEEGRYRLTGSQVALRHTLLRRWGKQGRQRKRQRLTRIISATVVAAILIALAIPLCIGLVGYNTYTNVKNVATEGVDNLLALQALLPANKNDIMSILNAGQLTAAKTRLDKAQGDFLQLQDMVNRPDIQSLLQQFAPQYSGKLDMARRLVTVALDVSRMGQELVGVAQLATNALHSGSLLSSGAKTPLVTADTINTIEAALVHAQYYIGDVQTQMSQVNLAQVPFGTASQKARLSGYLRLLPQVQDAIVQVQGLVSPISWLLGVGSTRHYLVQTLDRAELRPSGGFEGQYGVITIDNGRLGPVSLTDIAKLDYGENGNELGNHPPALYKWMDFGNFGVRDANLSADFPTTARMVMQLFQLEGGGPVDGDIQFTPVVIEQLLQMTGPLYVKEYGETITAQNLESKLHLYQQNYHYIDIQAAKTGQYTHQTRKAFTSLVGQLLLDRARHLSMTQLLALGKTLLKDLKSRDLQMYFTNAPAEQWLTQNGYSGAMPALSNGTDGFMVVQANVSISKASQYVHSTFDDQVMLNADGSATHQLTITLDYNQLGPVYGYDTYADYVRVYAPASAQFLSGYGFDSGHALCTPGGKTTTGGGGGGGNGGGGGGTGTGKTTGCSQYTTSFPGNGARSCPSGVYTLGYDGMIAKPFPIDSLGGPTAQHSDLPGYQMWGGLTLTPKNCTTTLTLNWIVPRMVQNTPGRPPYQLIVGHQAGWPVTARIAVDASALKGVRNFSFTQTINVDTLVALPARPLPPSAPQPKTPTPAVTPTATAKKA